MAFDFPASPTLGQTYGPTGGPTYIWNGSNWIILTPGYNFARQTFTATAGQTTFTISTGYVVGAIDIYRNGVKLLVGTDVTATDSNTIVLANAAQAGDTIETVNYAILTYINAVPKSGGNMTGNLGFTSGSGGIVTIAPPTTASNYTATLPARTGNLAMDGPAFSAYLGTNQTVTTSTFTKVACGTEEFDTNSNYDNSTYRFTPTVAGYYQVNGCLAANTTTNALQIVTIYKNGAEFKRGVSLPPISGSLVTAAALIYMNGSTDYLELYGYINNGTTFVNGNFATYFQAFLARSA